MSPTKSKPEAIFDGAFGLGLYLTFHGIRIYKIIKPWVVNTRGYKRYIKWRKGAWFLK